MADQALPAAVAVLLCLSPGLAHGYETCSPKTSCGGGGWLQACARADSNGCKAWYNTSAGMVECNGCTCSMDDAKRATSVCDGGGTTPPTCENPCGTNCCSGGQTCCGNGRCAPEGGDCCGDSFCSSGQVCTEGGTERCCPAGYPWYDRGVCCPDNQPGCGSCPSATPVDCMDSHGICCPETHSRCCGTPWPGTPWCCMEGNEEEQVPGSLPDNAQRAEPPGGEGGAGDGDGEGCDSSRRSSTLGLGFGCSGNDEPPGTKPGPDAGSGGGSGGPGPKDYLVVFAAPEVWSDSDGGTSQFRLVRHSQNGTEDELYMLATASYGNAGGERRMPVSLLATTRFSSADAIDVRWRHDGTPGSTSYLGVSESIVAGIPIKAPLLANSEEAVLNTDQAAQTLLMADVEPANEGRYFLALSIGTLQVDAPGDTGRVTVWIEHDGSRIAEGAFAASNGRPRTPFTLVAVTNLVPGQLRVRWQASTSSVQAARAQSVRLIAVPLDMEVHAQAEGGPRSIASGEFSEVGPALSFDVQEPGDYLLLLNLPEAGADPNQTTRLAIQVDGERVVEGAYTTSSPDDQLSLMLATVRSLSSGPHNIQTVWRNDGGAPSRLGAASRRLIALPLSPGNRVARSSEQATSSPDEQSIAGLRVDFPPAGSSALLYRTSPLAYGATQATLLFLVFLAVVRWRRRR